MIRYQKQEKKFNIKAHFSLFIHDQDLTSIILSSSYKKLLHVSKNIVDYTYLQIPTHTANSWILQIKASGEQCLKFISLWSVNI